MDSYHPLSLIPAGQNQLKETLRLQAYEAIAQRVDIRFHLPVMTKDQTCAYIRHHLFVAGAAGEIFTAAAMAVIHEYCAGVARKVNNLCTASLMAGAGREQRQSRRYSPFDRELCFHIPVGLVPVIVMAGDIVTGQIGQKA